MRRVLAVLAVFLLGIGHSRGDDVLGCGGFIKSHVPIDYSKIEVKLLTKQGSLKDSTFCAPNNGYYFLPLYDKGEYVIKVVPPAGWGFKKTEEQVNVDGSSDLCSLGKDIDFVFEGFGITGQVQNVRGDGAPAGIQVELSGQGELRNTLTGPDGQFSFTPVYPGNYVLKASHERWKFAKSVMHLKVESGNMEVPSKSLVVAGYDVKGFVASENEPVAGVHFLLFSNDIAPNTKIDGCNYASIPNLESTKKHICYVTSKSDGVFEFPCLPPGNYEIVPHYKGEKINFDVEPKSLKFAVSKGSAVLTPDFGVTGFNVRGRVLNKENGDGVKEARVYINGQEMAVTDAAGYFVLDKMTTGTYQLLVTSDELEFRETKVKISPSQPILGDIVPSGYMVCGQVLSQLVHTLKIFRADGSETVFVNTDSKGSFCQSLPSGKYKLSVVVTDEQSRKGLQFFPVIQDVEVDAEPLKDLVFSQLRARVEGSVVCLDAKDYASIRVSLKPLHLVVAPLVAKVKGGRFEFDDALPGSYEVSVIADKLCWQEKVKNINVESANASLSPFQQTGYLLKLNVQHQTTVNIEELSAAAGAKPFSTALKLDKGLTEYCLPKSGSYLVKVDDCRVYAVSSVRISTGADSNEVSFVPVKYEAIVRISASSKIEDLEVVGGESRLPAEYDQQRKQHVVRFHLKPGDQVRLGVKSAYCWFDAAEKVFQGKDDCHDFGVQFVGRKGVVVKGSISPALAGVKVSLAIEGQSPIVRTTDAEGKYSFEPFDDSKAYSVSAEKESFVFTGPDKNGRFLAHKLAEVVVEVVDTADDSPLQGALVSLSGGESYRKNLQTEADGSLTFASLSPSDYFLKPMMKEYVFEPSSKIIQVLEGDTVRVKLSGRRVAFSVYGDVTSLNDDPESNVAVRAVGLGNCSGTVEEATTEKSGSFRVRGLQPYCSYSLQLRLDPKTGAERVSPESLVIQAQEQDVRGVRMILFHSAKHTDILAKVFAKNAENYKSIRLKMYKESSPNSPLYTLKPEQSAQKVDPYGAGVLLQFPSIPLDRSLYFVQLEFMGVGGQVQYFTANVSFVSLDFELTPKSELQDENIQQTSLLALPFIFLVFFGVYNIKTVMQFLTEKASRLKIDQFATFVRSTASADKTYENEDLDKLVQTINSPKRKAKSKKV